MALMKCPECKNDVSDSANTCPHCGYNLLKYRMNSTMTKPRKFTTKGCLITLVLFCLFVVSCISMMPEKEERQAVEVKPKTEKEIQDSLDNACFESFTPYRINAAIMDELNDPDSYKFLNYRRGPRKGDSILVLVEFSAKNGFGGRVKSIASYYTRPPKKGMNDDYKNKDWCPILHLNIVQE